ncbi:SMI1/KNR4 family protein [Deinococcus sp. UYEF24]
MTPLEAIEERFEFSYPTLYKQLYTEGLLDIGQFGPQWMTSEFPRLRLRPPLLLFGHDFELMQLEDIAEETAEFFNPDSYREVRPGLRFVPFAMTGGGDLYCFHLNAATEAGVPVVYVWHDADEATFQAKNLQDFIFRGLLEAVVGIDKESLIATDDLSENCRAMLATHGPFLSPRQRQLVEDLYARDVTGYTSQLPNGREYQTRGLLSPDELAQILRAEIGFEHLDRRFGYMREE